MLLIFAFPLLDQAGSVWGDDTRLSVSSLLFEFEFITLVTLLIVKHLLTTLMAFLLLLNFWRNGYVS